MSNVTYLPWVSVEADTITGSPEVSGEPVVHSADHESAAALSAEELEALLLRKLSGHDFSIAEIRAWLVDRDAPEADAEELIEKCQRLGYLDDARLAGELVARLGERKHKSRQVIARELHRRQISPTDIANALHGLSDESELDKAIALAQTRERQLLGLEPGVAQRRMLGFLARRGYSGNTAITAMRTVLKLNGHD